MSLRVAGGPVRGRGIRGLRGDPFSRVFLKRQGAASLLPGISVARTGAIWCPQVDDTMAQFADNAPAFEAFEGRPRLRVDPGWTQYVTAPTDATHISWLKTRCTPDTVAAPHPFGGGTMSAIREDVSSNSHFFQTNAITSVAGAAYTATAIIYPEGRNFAALTFTGAGGADRGVFVNLTTGSIMGAFASFPALYKSRLRSDGGTEVSISEAAPGAAGYAARLYICNSANGSIYQGDGTSGIRVAVLNHTNTSYQVPYTTFSGSIGNSTIGLPSSLLGFSLSGGFSYGGAVAVLNRIAAQYPSVINFRPDSVAGSNETVEVFASPTDKQLFALVRTGGLDTYGQVYTGPTNTSRFSQRAAANNFQSAFNGSAQPVDLSGAMPSVSYIQIGRNGVANLGAMLIDDLWVTPRLLNAAELTALSV